LVSRVLDDIKESVRVTAKISMKSLSELTTRFCDVSLTPAAQGKEALEIALPFLLQQGLVSEAEEVRNFSLKQILKITKVASFLLRPHIPHLVAVLLEGLSVFEPASFNYASFHTDKMNITTEQFEQARISISSFSPMNEAIELALKQVDSSNLEALIGKLIETIRTGVGLPTKVGCCKLISSLLYSKKFSDIPATLTSKLVSALINYLKDKSPIVRKNAATAIANLAKVISDRSMRSLIDHLIDLYNDPELEFQISGAFAFLELAKRAPDQLKSHYPRVLPLFYLGKHADEDKEITGDTNGVSLRKLYREIWEECGGAVGSVRLYLSAIVSMLSAHLSSNSWSQKKQAALAMKEMAETLDEGDLCRFCDELLRLLLEIGLPGRQWKGKESVLAAISAISNSCKDLLVKNTSSAYSVHMLVTAVGKECQKRTDKEYRRHALISLASLLKTFSTMNFFEVVKVILFPIASGEEEIQPEEDDPKEKPLHFLIKAAAFRALGASWPESVYYETQAKYAEEFLRLNVRSLSNNVWCVFGFGLFLRLLLIS